MSTLRGIAIGLYATVVLTPLLTGRWGSRRVEVRSVNRFGVGSGFSGSPSTVYAFEKRRLLHAMEGYMKGSGGQEEAGYILSLAEEEPGESLEKASKEEEEVEVEVKNEVGREDEEEEEEEEEEVNPALYSTVVMIISILLILLTIGFEKMEISIENRAEEAMKPIIDSLFGEMTVLGFLSVFTFVLGEIPAFTRLSVMLFNESNTLMEILEFVHYTIFFVMIFFVLEVLILLKMGEESATKWMKMDRIYQNSHIMKNEDTNSRLGRYMMKDLSNEMVDDQPYFNALRTEFMLGRSPDSLKPAEIEHRLLREFNFGLYLSKVMLKMLQDVVDLHAFTWVFFALFSVVVYGVNMLSGNDRVISAWFWVAIGWSAIFFNKFFYRHLLEVLKALVPPLPSESLYSKANETLPPWTSINMKDYMRNRSWLVEKFVGNREPTRLQTLFWFERKGPSNVYIFIIQTQFVFLSLYCAILLLSFFGSMWTDTNAFVFALYVVLAIAPVILVIFKNNCLVSAMVQVMAMIPRPQIISDVLQEEMVENSVRAFLVLHTLSNAMEKGFKNKRTRGKSYIAVKFEHFYDPSLIERTEAIFGFFDQDNDGFISASEFGAVMASLKIQLDENQTLEMVSMFDDDGDGKVSKDEFLQWYADSSCDGGQSMEEKAYYLFQIFDQDKNGQISITELSDALKGFHSGLNIDQIMHIMKALDKNGDGEIGVEEFENLFENYYPNEWRTTFLTD